MSYSVGDTFQVIQDNAPCSFLLNDNFSIDDIQYKYKIYNTSLDTGCPPLTKEKIDTFAEKVTLEGAAHKSKRRKTKTKRKKRKRRRNTKKKKNKKEKSK